MTSPPRTKESGTLAEVVSVFITQARDKYGLGRFMPDELPLLDEMARLARIDLDAQAIRDHAKAQPTPPSGPTVIREQVGETPAKTTTFRRGDGSPLIDLRFGPVKHLRTRLVGRKERPE